MLEKIKEFIKNNPTLPGYKWAGFSSIGGSPVSWLDDIASRHDSNTKTSMVKTWTFNIGLIDAIENIKADLFFIAEFFIGILTLFSYPYIVNKSGRTKKQAIFWILKDLFYGGLGCIVFVVNIFVNLLNWFYRLIKLMGK